MPIKIATAAEKNNLVFMKILLRSLYEANTWTSKNMKTSLNKPGLRNLRHSFEAPVERASYLCCDKEIPEADQEIQTGVIILKKSLSLRYY